MMIAITPTGFPISVYITEKQCPFYMYKYYKSLEAVWNEVVRRTCLEGLFVFYLSDITSDMQFHLTKIYRQYGVGQRGFEYDILAYIKQRRKADVTQAFRLLFFNKM